MSTQLREPPFVSWLKQQHFALIVIFPPHSSMYKITDLYNRDLQATIILYTSNVSSHKTEWIPSELSVPALSCHLYRRLSSVINWNLNKCEQFYFYFCILYTLSLQCCCCILFICLSLFYTTIVTIFLFICWSVKQT